MLILGYKALSELLFTVFLNCETASKVKKKRETVRRPPLADGRANNSTLDKNGL